MTALTAPAARHRVSNRKFSITGTQLASVPPFCRQNLIATSRAQRQAKVHRGVITDPVARSTTSTRGATDDR